MRLGVVKEKGLVRALTKALHTDSSQTLRMKAPFVLLINARPFSAPVSSLKKKKKAARSEKMGTSASLGDIASAAWPQ